MGINKEFEQYHRRLFPDYEEFIAALRKPSRRSIRVNNLKVDRARVEDFLKKNNIPFSQIPWCPDGLWIDSDCELDTVEHQLGYYYIQNSSSMIPSLALDPYPEDYVLDMCAAPGSKTTHIAQLMENIGVLVANEASFVRVRALVINIQKAGASNVTVTRRDGVGYERYNQRFDKVLLDAPCSDIGTARKNSQVIARWTVDRVHKLSNLQKKLIMSAYNSLRVGGTLVYSTCTTSREENEEVIEHLLKEKKEATIEKFNIPGIKTREGMTNKTRNTVRIMPQDNDTESYYIAKIIKTDEEKDF